MKKQGLEERALELPAGAITVIAAASGHGKTAMLINLILDVCRLHPDKEFHFFSLEESAAAVTAKMLNTFLDLDFSGRNEPALEAYLKGDTRFIKNEYLSELREKEAQFWPLLGKQIFIHYLEQGTAEEFCEAVQWLHRRRNVGAVFADYLQLFGLENRGKLDRQEELKRVCLMLKNTAIETGLPLCFAAQFNREVTTEKKSQEYTKIGEAGDIERVAALILGLWNRSFNPPKKKETEGEQEAPAPADIMAARVLKWRGGPVGYGAAWKWDGNRKRIYPNTTTTGAAAPGAPGAMPAEVKKLLNQ
jgi:replicative DNA helicase